MRLGSKREAKDDQLTFCATMLAWFACRELLADPGRANPGAPHLFPRPSAGAGRRIPAG